MKSVALHNLGCKVNGYEMEVMQQMLQQRGYKIVSFDEEADIYIINTCTVTNIADRKSRQLLHRARRRNPKAVVVAVGCYVQVGKEEALQDTAIDLAVGNQKKKDLIPILEEFLINREKQGENTDKTLSGKSVVEIGAVKEYERMALVQMAGHTRAYIKIQDGCNQFCSYCIIPYARGRVRSRDKQEILEEIEKLVREGCKEVVLTGIHISSYGTDGGEGERLSVLVEEAAGIEGLERIRLGSLEPGIITKEFAEKMAGLPKVCAHFHLSLQSGCNETLKRMNRHYTTEEYAEKVMLLRQAYGSREPAFTTDVITGFPGESEEEFQQTYDFLKKIAFFEMHVFKYSKRRGTKAAEMEGQIPEEVKAARSNRLLQLHGEMSGAYLEKFLGKEAEVLLEEKKEIEGGVYWIGHTEEYIRAAVSGEGALPGSFSEGMLVQGRINRFLTPEILLLKKPLLNF